jgi:PmbA protein
LYFDKNKKRKKMKTVEKINLAQWVIDRAKKCGADQAAVLISKRREVEIENRDKKLEKLKESTQNSLALDIYVQSRYSNHTTNDLREDSLAKLIDEAVSGTKYLTKDEYRSLPDPTFYPKETQVDLKIRDESYDAVDAKQRKAMAEEIEQAAMAQSDQIISTTSAYSDVFAETTRVHSNGFSGQIEGTIFSAGAEVTVRDGESGRPSDWYWASTRYHSDLPAPEVLGKYAATRALRKIGQKKIDSGQYTMLVENRSGGRLLSTLYTPMRGRSLQQKNSFLENMLDKQIASEKLTIFDDPFVKKGLGSKIFDGEGLAVKKRVMIEQGVLRNYYINDYYGKKLGMTPNSGSTSNIIFDYGTKSLDDLLPEVGKGILVTGFIGGNSNSTTGDFSFGIVGQLVENGQIVQPINEMNITGNAKEFWHKLLSVGNDPYPYSSWRIPSMMFEKVHFSGV